MRADLFSTRPFRAGLLVLAMLPLAACDTISSLNPFDKPEVYKPEVKPTIPAEQLYNEGLAYIDKKEFDGAAKRFGELDKAYPFSVWSQRALLMQTYANFEARNYDDAIAAGKRYLGLHPASPEAAYAAYLVGQSYYNQIPDTTRDQERSEKALLAFQEVVQRWPQSEYAADAKFKLNVVKDQLAGREMNVGRYYLKKRNYPAAINRFRVVVAQFQQTNQIEEALARLTEAYLALGVIGEAETAAAVLGHNFPDSPWYKDAFNLLQSRGLAPRESGDSWITKAFKSVGMG
jgi:outer membrane protein assembly factor BamD